jgi:hypothetical protein
VVTGRDERFGVNEGRGGVRVPSCLKKDFLEDSGDDSREWLESRGDGEVLTVRERARPARFGDDFE